MLSVRIILENSSTLEGFPGKHGLSLMIDFGSQKMLYDFGPRNHLARGSFMAASAISFHTGHCTGDYALHILAGILKGRLAKISTGMTLSI